VIEELHVPGVKRGTVVGGYTVTRWLGAGGWGCVYEAELDGQRYALKFVPLGRRGWGQREATILLRLQHLEHPHVVKLVAYTQWPVAEPRWLVLVMDFVQGRPLPRWAEEDNPTARQVARVVADVARGLEAVHGEGVVHRDIKGANILVRQEDGRAVVVDFGVGGYEGAPSLTPYVLPFGTPQYQAPEAWAYALAQEGRTAPRYVPGPKDDLWALGVTLYELLTARLPFVAEDELGVGETIIHHQPPTPREVNGRVPEGLSRICMRLLEKAPEARYARAAEVVREVEEALGGAGGEWDAPLCEGYGPSTATTEGRAEVVGRGDAVGWEAWAHEAALPPRRGRKPVEEEATPVLPEAGVPGPAKAVEPPPESADEAGAAASGEAGAAREEGRAGTQAVGRGEEAVTEPAASPPTAPPPPRAKDALDAPGLAAHRAPGAPMAAGAKPPAAGPAVVGTSAREEVPAPGASVLAARRAEGAGRRGGWKWGGVLLVAVALGAGWWAGRVRASQQVGREVARAAPPPDAGPATAPPQAEATPVVAASVAAPAPQGASVKKPKSPVSAAVQQVKQTTGAVGACLALACASSSPQVRPPPDPAPCPEKSLQAMKALDIELGEVRSAAFPGGQAGDFLQVREGRWKVELREGYSKKFRGRTELYCYLTLSDRVYGRCSSARTDDGTTHPVCFEMLDTGKDLGIDIEEGSTGDSARVLSVFKLRPVREYR
jgi:predicted Ser/Thr protein kinase